jgi:hypothetical protein
LVSGLDFAAASGSPCDNSKLFKGDLMAKSIFKMAAIGAFALAALPTPSFAQARAPKPPAEITVTNARSDAMVGIVIQTTGEKPRIVGSIPKGLAAGKSAKLKLMKPVGCTYNVLARFADGTETEAEDIDLCADKTLRLTD